MVEVGGLLEAEDGRAHAAVYEGGWVVVLVQGLGHVGRGLAVVTGREGLRRRRPCGTSERSSVRENAVPHAIRAAVARAVREELANTLVVRSGR